MSPLLLLADLRRAGLSLRAEGDRLFLAPADRIGPLAIVVKAHKAELLALLAAPDLVAQFEAEARANAAAERAWWYDPFEEQQAELVLLPDWLGGLAPVSTGFICWAEGVADMRERARRRAADALRKKEAARERKAAKSLPGLMAKEGGEGL